MAESLRDQLSKVTDEIIARDAPETTEPAPQVEAPAVPLVEGADNKPAEVAAPVEADKPGRTAGRARDEQGRLLPGKADPAAKAPASVPEVAPVVAPIVARPPRPSSWKKDYWEHWDKLDPKLAEYINQREGEYAKGVSTYKTEWERAKPLIDAVAPHQQMFQQMGIDPAQQFSKYVEIHKGLAMGSPEQKLSTLLSIAQDYQIPLANLFVQGQDGKVYFNPQVQRQQPAPQQQQAPDVKKLVQEALNEQMTNQEIERMRADTKTYPHFEAVKQTMSGLLQAGIATDLPSAYAKALRMHDDLWASEQEATRKATEAANVEAQRKAADVARRNAVSPKSSTPQGAQAGAKKGLRATLEDAVETHTASRL